MASLPRQALLFSAKALTAGAAVTCIHSYRRTLLLESPPPPDSSSRTTSTSTSTTWPPTLHPFSSSTHPSLPTQLCEFINASPSPHHVVANSTALLRSHGFTPLSESSPWSIQPGGRYYVQRNRDSSTSLAAFIVGKDWRPGDAFSIVGTHVDSPCLRLKPISARPPVSQLGYLQLGVETYGGGLWHSWLDRDLGIAGRVFVRDGDDDASGSSSGVSSHLVNVAMPLLHIPSLAAHYRRHNPLTIDLENHLLPVLGSEGAHKLWQADDNNPFRSTTTTTTTTTTTSDTSTAKHKFSHASIAQQVATQLSVSPNQVLGLDLVLYDLQPAVVGGMYGEYVFGARMDNLFMSFCALTGFVKSLEDEEDNASPSASKGTTGLGGFFRSAKDDVPSSNSSVDRSIRVLAMFDHEEIGSEGASTAKSTFIPHVLKRLCTEAVGTEGSSQALKESRGAVSVDSASAFERSMAKSFFLSADMTHATHPAHTRVAEKAHLTVLNGGLVISSTPGNSFMRNTPGACMLEEVARRSAPIYQSLLGPSSSSSPSAPVPSTSQQVSTAAPASPNSQTSGASQAQPAQPAIQYFVNPNDVRCGSTLGPQLATNAGLRTLDVGCCQLSMHSTREMAGAGDVATAVAILSGFWKYFGDVDGGMRVGEV